MIVKAAFFTTTAHFLPYLEVAGSGLASSGMALGKQCRAKGVKALPPGWFPSDLADVSVALPCAVGATGRAWVDLCTHGSHSVLCWLLSSISALLQMVNYPLLLCVCAKDNCRLPLRMTAVLSNQILCF